MKGSLILENKDESLVLKVVPRIIVSLLILFGTYNAVFSLLGFIFCAIYIYKNDETADLELLFYLMSLAPIFKLSSNSSSLFTYLEVGFILLTLFRSRFVSKKEFVFVLIYSFYLLVFQILFSELNLTSTIKMIANIVILLRITRISIDNSTSIFVSYVSGVLCSSVFRFLDSPFFKISEFVSQKTIGFGDGVFVTRFSGLYTDPNYYAVSVIIALCLVVFLYLRKNLSLLITILFSVPLFIFAGMTGSKSALLMLIIPVLEMVYICLKRRKFHILFFFLVAVVLVIIGVVSGRISVFNSIFDRLSIDKVNIDSLTSGRTVIWRDYFNYFNENVIKVIFGSSISVTAINTSISFTEPHSTYIDLILQLGIIGTIIYLSGIYLAFINSRTNIKRGLHNYILIVVLLVMYSFLSQLQGYDLPFQLGMCLMLLNCDFTNVLERGVNE